MATRVNKSSGRPILAPLWTGDQKLNPFSATAFRTAQGPLLSPSPMSPRTLPSPMYPTSSDKAIRSKDRALVDSLSHQTSPSSLSSPKSRTPIEGQSPLVSKLEEVSLQLTDAGKRKLPEFPSAEQREPKTPRAHNKLKHQEYDGGMRTAFVIARSIRRQSKSTDETSQSSPSQQKSPEPSVPRRLTIRAIIRPKSPARPTFLIQRSLNIDEGQVTVPASAAEKSSHSTSPSKGGRKPLPVPAKWVSKSRRQSMGLSLPRAERPSKPLSHPADYEELINDPKAIPIHLQHAVSSLPALAALLTSGHVRSGDIIYLPVPHAESWPQTVRYVYGGQGELTDAVRENITYLGGNV
ncbi:hypothetical protein GGS21DRAFT_351613 [Xylaria nigripes]|nr:hypothetical protein GGS21DRAFT_351613 [Xylaria nigripes]